MIFPGVCNNKKLPNINQQLLELQGYLSDEEARDSLCKFLRYNLDFTVELMTGKKLFPFQQMAIRGMFQKDFFLMVCGRGFSKSWSVAMFAWLYAVMTPNARIGILSKTFRQSQVIFKYIEDFANSPGGELLRQCFVGDPSHKNEVWEMNIGSSRIVALPLGEGSKLRGARFNVILIDELLLMPENVINEVILPFISVNFDPIKRKEVSELEDKLIEQGLLKPEDRTLFSNPKFIGLSSASYKFEFLYKIYKEYYDKITTPGLLNENGTLVDSSGYGIMQISYEMAPKFLYNDDTITKLKSQMSEGQFDREFKAVFTDDSGGFFSKRKMDLCTVKNGNEPTIEIWGGKDAKYLLAIDPSFSKSESSDHFAMGLFRLNEEDQTSTLVHNYAIAGGQLQDHMRYFAYLLKAFNIVYVIIDNAGHWFVDECNASVIFSEKGLNLNFFEADFDNEEYLKGLRTSRDSYSLGRKLICHRQVFNSQWIRRANEHLAACFDHQRVWFASEAMEEKFKSLKEISIPEDLVYDNTGEELVGMARKADFIDHQAHLIDLVKSETALIEIKESTSGGGTQTFQLPQTLRRSDAPDRARRDNYTTLLLGTWACKCYYDLMYKEIEEPMSFLPFFIR